MRRTLIKFIVTALMAVTFTSISLAQTRMEVRSVDSDSLISYLRTNLGMKVYFARDSKDRAEYSVSAPSDKFVDAAVKELSGKGYVCTFYDGGLYVTSGPGIASSLPTGYFDEAVSGGNDELEKYIQEENAIAAFQNRVYEIGDGNSGHTGKARVSGHVTNIATGEPLIGVSVLDEATGTYAVTDTYGFYTILMPVGEGRLSFSGYSMEDMTLNVNVNDDGGLDVLMKEKVTSLKEAVISAESVAAHKDAKMGVETVRINTLTHVPVAFGEADVLKVVTTLPGVKSVGEASSGFNVRGGSVDQNLILFNDGTIFNPSHMFGIFSAFNTEVINDVQLYKSSIPVEFGGRISSVLDIRGREGNSNKVEGSLGVGLLTSRFHLEGPLKKGKTTFLIGARTTYSDWMMKLIPENSGYHNGKAQFYDINASISHKFNDRTSIHAYGYFSRDRFSFTGDTLFRYRNINASVKLRSNFSSNHNMVASVGYDQYSNDLMDTYQTYAAYKYSTAIRQAWGKVNFKYMVNENHTVSYGGNLISYIMNPGKRTPMGDMSMIRHDAIPTESALEMALYAGDNWRINSKLSLEGGVRLTGFTAFESPRFYGMPEARISGKYSFLPNLSLKAGFNTMRQYIHLVTNTASISPMDTWKICDKNIRPQDGWQAAAGLYWSFADNQFDMSVETYYKRMYNYLDYKSGAVLVMNHNLADDLVPTRGQAYGVEFMIKKPHGKLNGWIAYTYARTLLQEMQDRGVSTINGGAWYPAAHDKPHDVKVVANYKFTHRYSVSMNLDYSTGRPVTLPVGQYYYGGGLRLAYSERNGYRIPDYFRLDLAMNIEAGHYLKALTHCSVTFGVYNVTGRKNAYSVYFTTSGGTDVTGHKLCVFASPIPYINLNLKF